MDDVTRAKNRVIATVAPRRTRCLERRYAVAVVVLMSATCLTQTTRADAHPVYRTSHTLPPSAISSVIPKSYTIDAMSGVPSTGDVYVLAGGGRTSVIAYRHAGSWSRITLPRKLRSRASTIAAAAGALWVAGGKYHDGHATPLIAERVGTRWRIASLPALYAGRGHLPEERVTGVIKMSASSATNAWAVGGLYARHSQDPVGLHWDGTSWKAVPDDAGFGLGAVPSLTTSSPTNAWIADGRAILRWDGTKWSVNKSIPPRDQESPSISSSSPSDAWMVSRTLVLHFDGTGWQKVSLPGKTSSSNLEVRDVSVVGTTAWIAGNRGRGGGRALVLRSDGDRVSAVRWPDKNDHVSPLFIAALASQKAWIASTEGSDERPLLTEIHSG